MKQLHCETRVVDAEGKQKPNAHSNANVVKQGFDGPRQFLESKIHRLCNEYVSQSRNDLDRKS